MYRRTLQTFVAAAALFAFTAAYSAPASAADDTFKTGSKASLTMSGQVNRAVLFADDGTDSEVFHVDNDNSSTRIRWVGKGKVTENFSMGMLIEVQLESNSTADVNIAGHEAATDSTNSFGERKMEVWLSNKNLGKLTLGQGDTASNGSAELNFLGQGAMYPGIADMSGGILFRDSTDPVGGDATGPAINTAWATHDGLSRQDRIRYDTPKIEGFVASASHIQGGNWDIGLRHSGKFGQFKTKAAIFYANTEGTSSTNDDQVNGSFAILHDSGLNLTFSAGTRDSTRKDDDHIYVALGYIAKLTDVGTTRFSVDYGNTNDRGQDGDDFTTFGIAVTQNIKAIGADIYATFRNHELDRTGSNFDDINSFLAGARVKF